MVIKNAIKSEQMKMRLANMKAKEMWLKFKTINLYFIKSPLLHERKHNWQFVLEEKWH